MIKFYRYLYLPLIFTAFIVNPLQAKKPTYLSYTEEKDGITVAVKELSPQESRKKLSSHIFSSRRNANSIVPVVGTITNYSNRAIRFAKKDIGLKLVSSDIICKKLESAERGQLLAGILSSLLLIPLCLFVAFDCLLLYQPVLCAICCMVALSLPICVYSDWKKARTVKKKVVKPYESLGVMDVEPGESTEFTFYVRKNDFHKSFKMAVQDVVSKKNTYFTVTA